ncbi:uncharacterized protein LOC111696310, partial [Eurytemora carolleeae]|uniref:uncharacterized protein LOC111696310 n=1 Tax=Eurytemora carolleeae TaxID=1294199 RepID=UPI000C759028
MIRASTSGIAFSYLLIFQSGNVTGKCSVLFQQFCSNPVPVQMYSRSYIVSDLDFLSAPPPPSILSFSDSWTPLIREELSRYPRQIIVQAPGGAHAKGSRDKHVKSRRNRQRTARKQTIPESHRVSPITRKPVYLLTNNPKIPASQYSEYRKLPLLASHQVRPTTRKPVYIGSRQRDQRQIHLPLDILTNSIPSNPTDCGVSMRAEERILGGLEAGFKQFPWAAIVTVTGNNTD